MLDAPGPGEHGLPGQREAQLHHELRRVARGRPLRAERPDARIADETAAQIRQILLEARAALEGHEGVRELAVVVVARRVHDAREEVGAVGALVVRGEARAGLVDGPRRPRRRQRRRRRALRQRRGLAEELGGEPRALDAEARLVVRRAGPARGAQRVGR